MTKIQSVRGTKDLFRDSYESHQAIIDIAKKLADIHLYEGLDVPIIEYASTFDRTLGVSSDIVSKEMYVFSDKGDGLLALRPEFTASIIRAFISNGWQQYLPLKLFSYGPVFRYDRPQAARQRQFHQLNYENLGVDSPFSDAELLKLAKDLATKLDIEKDLTLEINSLGCFESRQKYNQILFDYFSKYESSLSIDSKNRLHSNPLRILDSKDLNDQEIVALAPVIETSYSNESRSYFESVLKYLDIFEIDYKINPHLVRGLDYYCHTAFEFTTNKLGAQNTIIAGGRYDGLCKNMGGPDLPAIGFAAGLERIALLKNFTSTKTRPTIILPLDEISLEYSLKLLNKLHELDIKTSIDINGNLDKRLKKALKYNAKYVIFIGELEQQDNKYRIKNLDNREESQHSFNDLLTVISAHTL
jgi:histidyl-tRNA synthetase